MRSRQIPLRPPLTGGAPSRTFLPGQLLKRKLPKGRAQPVASGAGNGSAPAEVRSHRSHDGGVSSTNGRIGVGGSEFDESEKDGISGERGLALVEPKRCEASTGRNSGGRSGEMLKLARVSVM